MKKLFTILILSIFIYSCSGDDYYNLGVYQAKHGNYKKAIEYFSKAINKNPKDAEAYYDRAYSQQTLGGNENQIIADYTMSLKYHPDDYEAYMNLGVAKMTIGKTLEAIEDFKKSIEINPDYPVVYANLGDAYKIDHDNENACLNWERSLKLGDKNVQQRINLYCK